MNPHKVEGGANGVLRPLIVEDLRSDVELMLDQLKQEGYAIDARVVAAEADYVAAIAQSPDVILCDWRMPRFSGERALALRQELQPEIPFVIVSGRIGEEAAVDAMHAGADDYVLKDRLSRLGPAVRRAIAFNRAQQDRQRAQSADQAKSIFLATMSHDLRAPLNSIIGYSNLLLSGAAGPMSDEQREHLSIVNASGRHLLELISDLLDVSRIESGGLQLRPENLDLFEILEEQCALLRLQAQDRGLALRSELRGPDVRVMADAARLRQVVANLLSNAIKFTDRGAVTVTASVIDGKARVTVEDTGIGIPCESQDAIFDLFHRLSVTPGTSREGSGLGLTICKRLVEAMGGEIGVDSDRSRGSRFWFTLPLAGPVASAYA